MEAEGGPPTVYGSLPRGDPRKGIVAENLARRKDSVGARSARKKGGSVWKLSLCLTWVGH